MALFTGGLFAQGTLTGKIKDDMTGEPLIGASVVLEGTTTGATTDMDGVFTLDLPSGMQKVVISYVGFEDVVMDIDVANGETKNLGKVLLQGKAIGMAGLEIIADRAKERETPVAISNVSKKQLEENLGSRDLPMVMNNTPSVYATPQGGGAGDARINVRGFNQRNVAIMVNGVPINDMENGWVYWSNWDGVADATSSIQMQRGLSAINLATPSVGGTMNILTDPAAHKLGGSAKFEVGSGQFFKTTLSGHSGLINNKFAVSAAVGKKTGQGVIDKTWTDAWTYYLGAAYNINKNHRLEIYAVGATQRHGQNLYKQNAGAYDTDYAKDIYGDDNSYTYDYSKYTDEEIQKLKDWGVYSESGTEYATDAFPQADAGRLYNENWGPVNESYTGQQSWNGKSARDRYNSGYINERENYFHKPLANLNWYAQWSDKVSQFTTLYYSGGTGGGTGTYGKIQYDYAGPSRTPDWNSTISQNSNPEDENYGNQGILRNSVNNQWTVGAISKVKVDFTEKFKMQFGVDWRTAEIDHYREVRDLLGLQSYDDKYTRNDFGSQLGLGLGDKIAYNNTNTVDWFGGYVQAEYSTEKFSFYGTAGYSVIKYNFLDHFKTASEIQDGVDDDGNPIMIPDVNSGNLQANTDWIGGYQIKGGVNYNINETFSVFANVGIISKVPIFDAVIDDGDGTVAEDPQNENFTAFEGGAIYSTLDDKLTVKANYYYTKWQDRTLTRSIRVTEDLNGIAFIKGLDQLHQGFELEANYRPIKLVGIGGIASFAKWEYLNNVSAQVKTYDDGDYNTYDLNLYTKDLKVGDAPQTQFAAWVDIFPVEGLKLQFIMRHNSNHYADFNPANRDDETDTEQVWKTPSYTVFDAHANYQLPLKGKVGVNIFFHAFNLFDTFYVQDAVDNSAYNSFQRIDTDRMLSEDSGRKRTVIANPHTGSAAEVYLGLPFNFNLGVKVTI
ncbi:TonB-dependent receptor [Lentimicrobium sp. L6]|nr:TonB-dependent receptor [Lentimicrobium sp. S6]NPD84798.1 TonB-dependent receptor [Lentimicrobium sp. L6]